MGGVPQNRSYSRRCRPHRDTQNLPDALVAWAAMGRRLGSGRQRRAPSAPRGTSALAGVVVDEEVAHPDPGLLVLVMRHVGIPG